jgi:hypothetical protein
MVNVQKAFPDLIDQDEGFKTYSISYYSLAEEFGEIVETQDIGFYQGDILFLLKDGEKYGFLVQGYGSCSYCDALEGCGSYEDLQYLADSMEASVTWFDTAKEAYNYFLEWDKNDWYTYHKDEVEEFRQKVLKILY